ncbi:MAG: hypothetical protein ACR65X_10775 [Methylocystis sp.]
MNGVVGAHAGALGIGKDCTQKASGAARRSATASDIGDTARLRFYASPRLASGNAMQKALNIITRHSGDFE